MYDLAPWFKGPAGCKILQNPIYKIIHALLSLYSSLNNAVINGVNLTGHGSEEFLCMVIPEIPTCVHMYINLCCVSK